MGITSQFRKVRQCKCSSYVCFCLQKNLTDFKMSVGFNNPRLRPIAMAVSKKVDDYTNEQTHLGDIVENLDGVNIDKKAVDPDRLIKHPLQNAWTLWFFKIDKARTWEENQRPIITVTTVEDFWALYNHIEAASRLPPGSDYSIFKEGIFPDWEDPRNQAGGRWIINVDTRQRTELLDMYWLEIIFFLIGEHADHNASQVNGAVVNVRAKGDKLAVWLADAQPDAILRIGKIIKERLGIDPEKTIGYHIHNEEKIRQSSASKRKFFV